jgi:excisionase family DNA binding protein
VSGESIDLQEAAGVLGVHYQTAYKWVRSGLLPATRIRGRYRVDLDATRALAARREKPMAPRVRRPRGGYAALRERMFIHLVAGEERAVRRIVGKLIEDGVGLTTVAQELLVPALHRIGDEWSAGRITISVEHRASAVVERVLGEHDPAPRGRRRGTAAVAALSGDRHGLPTLLASAALREDNWRVHHLGADMPASEMLDFCTRNRVDLAVLTVTTIEAQKPARRAASLLRKAGVRTLVGRPDASLADLQRLARESRAVA